MSTKNKESNKSVDDIANALLRNLEAKSVQNELGTDAGVHSHSHFYGRLHVGGPDHSTSIFLIVIIHLVLLYQWKMRQTRKDIVTSYRQVVIQKKFHKAFYGILSHPFLDDTRWQWQWQWHQWQSSSPPSPPSSSSITIDMGMSTNTSDDNDMNDYSYGRSSSASQSSRTVRFARSMVTRIKRFARRPFERSNNNQGQNISPPSPLACLPLMAYVSHILWQVRPLEEIYDFEYDRMNYSNGNENASLYNTYDDPILNITSVLEAEKILQTSTAFHHSSPRHSASSSRHHHTDTVMFGSFRYYRVCMALMLTSFLMEMLMTHLIVTYIRQLRLPDAAFRSLSSSSSSSTSPSSSSLSPLLDRLTNRGICTLIPLCTSLVSIYASFFPHTSISVIPYFNTSNIGITSSSFGYVMVCIILCSLSFRIYPLLGVFYGSLSGILWVRGYTSFLATKYWGSCSIMTLGFMFALGYKLEYMALKRGGRGASSSQVDWFPWIDVYWNDTDIRQVDEEHDGDRSENDEEWNQ